MAFVVTEPVTVADSPRDAVGEHVLQTEKLVKIYGGRAVVNGVDINCRRGEIVGLLGPNGAGKTTSFYMIVGLVRPNGGKVLFDDEDVTDLPMYRRARMGMGYLPQEESIFRKLTVDENILAILETQALTRKHARPAAHELLTQFGIDHVAKQPRPHPFRRRKAPPDHRALAGHQAELAHAR